MGDIKECVILQYYVADYKDEYILNRCVDSVLKMGLDIILVSHSPISKEIQKKVKYFLYDGDDELVTFEDIFNEKVTLHTDKRFRTSDLQISPFLYVVDDISYAFCKAVYDVHKLAKSLGYTHSYYFVADFDALESEILEVRKISELVHKENKRGYFENNEVCIGCFYWYVDIEWFLNNFFINMNSKDEFFVDLKKLNLYCHYDHYMDYQANRLAEELIIVDAKFWGHTFVSEDRSDLSKTLKKPTYDNDIGIFYFDGIPHIFCFDYFKKNQWKLYIEYDNNEIIKYDVNLDYPIWRMFPIEEIKDKFTLKCFDKNDKLMYDVYVNDLESYKNKFKIVRI